MLIHESVKGLNKLISKLNTLDLKQQDFTENEFIVRKGESLQHFYWQTSVSSSNTAIQYIAENGRNILFPSQNGEHRFYGEIETITSDPHLFDVIALEPISLKVVPTSILLELMRQEPDVAIWFANMVTKRYQQVVETSFSFLLHSHAINIAADIHFKHKNQQPLFCFKKQADEAARFGCSERVYRRVLNQLVQLEILQKSKSTYLLINADKLTRFLANSQQ
ncbi:MAG: Crp/Fnr family transcriptional regulator [Parashewanella sp.]